MNIIETIQKNLGYAIVQKIDPNSQEVTDKESIHGNHALAQAAIPSVLLGLFNRLEKEPDASWLVADQPTGRLLEKIFGKSEDQVVEQIAAYSGLTGLNVKTEMEHIASESVRVVRDNISDLKNENKISAFVARHKQDVLLYLPATLGMGSLLGNNNLDDRTNKMEGPVSGLMHRLEKQFNSSENN
jgi:hypothetical protein